MEKIFKLSFLICCLFSSNFAVALTFKSDGTVVQNSGEVVTESFATRFGNQFFPYIRSLMELARIMN